MGRLKPRVIKELEHNQKSVSNKATLPSTCLLSWAQVDLEWTRRALLMLLNLIGFTTFVKITLLVSLERIIVLKVQNYSKSLLWNPIIIYASVHKGDHAGWNLVICEITFGVFQSP